MTKTAASTPFKAKTASAATATLPKTADSNWIAASLALFLLDSAFRCRTPLLRHPFGLEEGRGNRQKASFTFPKVGAHRLTPARPYC